MAAYCFLLGFKAYALNSHTEQTGQGSSAARGRGQETKRGKGGQEAGAKGAKEARNRR